MSKQKKQQEQPRPKITQLHSQRRTVYRPVFFHRKIGSRRS